MLNDPEVLRRCTPGCKELQKDGEDRYVATLDIGVAAVKGTYKGEIELVDKNPPESYTLVVNAQGLPGFVRARARFHLEEQGIGRTNLTYNGEAQVGGIVAGVGQRVLQAVGRFILGQFLKGLEKEVRERARAAG